MKELFLVPRTNEAHCAEVKLEEGQVQAKLRTELELSGSNDVEAFKVKFASRKPILFGLID